MITPGHLTVFDVCDDPAPHANNIPKEMYYSELTDVCAAEDLYFYYQSIGDIKKMEYWKNQDGLAQKLETQRRALLQA